MANLMKTAEEVAEFIENLGIEYKFNCLSEKDPEGCYLLGAWYEQEKMDGKQAAKAYKKGCDELNYSKCCDKIASFHYLGKGVEKDISKAQDYWLKGCYSSNGLTPRDPTLACFHGGQLLVGGGEGDQVDKSIKIDPSKGIEMLDKACKLNLGNACQSLHELFLFGNEYVPKDAAKSVEYGLIGCEQSNYACCHNSFLMLKKGNGVPQDLEKAKELKKKMKEIEYQTTNEMTFGQYL